jgi:hypothetical protein
MNLHIFLDDKFVDEFIDIANEVGSESNIYVVNAAKPFRYVKNHNAHAAKWGSQEFEGITGDLSQYKRVYIHFLTQEMCNFINRHAESRAIFLWVFWGGDLYENIPYPLYDEQTQSYLKQHRSQNKPSLYRTLRSWQSERSERLQRSRAIKRLDYILHFDEEEYKLIQQYYPTKAKFFLYYYPPVTKWEHLDNPQEPDENRTLMQQLHIDNRKKIILLGNSGYETGNHLSILQKLASQKPGEQQVIVPLSYGNPAYIDFIISEGTRLLEDDFKPITTFLPPQKYSNLLQLVDGGIFNSWRTQGSGNIMALLYLGKQVYLSPKTTLYHLAKGYGIAVDTIDHFFSMRTAPIGFEAIQLNREIILNITSEQASKKTISNILRLER